MATRNSAAFPALPGGDPFDAVLWANRESGEYVGHVKRMTDVGTITGGSLFQWDGTYWRPLNGRVCLAMRCGTIASPIHSMAGHAVGVLFTLPATITIPAGMIAPQSRVWISGQAKRTGANGTGQFDCQIGTAGAGSDSLVGRVQANATDGHVAVMESVALFSSSTTSFLPRGSASPQGSTGGGTVVDRSTNVNTASAMIVTFGITNANALDTFALHHYAVFLEC